MNRSAAISGTVGAARAGLVIQPLINGQRLLNCAVDECVAVPRRA